MTRNDPLDSLRRVRAEKVDQSARFHSDAVRQVEATRDVAAARERTRREHEQALAQTTAAERERLERGELTAADVARGAAWGIAADIERASHARAVEEACAAHGRAVSHAQDRQRVLAEAHASAEVVERHRRRWQKAREAEVIAIEEENAEESHLARKRGKK